MASKRALSTATPPGVAGLPRQAPFVSGGDAHHGFELYADKAKHILKMRLWGLWDPPMAVQFRDGVVKLGRELKLDSRGAPWAILADSRAFVAQSNEVTNIRKAAMHEATSLGCTRIAALVDKAVYTMQFRRITNESHMASAVFGDEASALRWLLEP